MRAINEYAADPSAFARMNAPVVLLVGSETPPERRDGFVKLASRLGDARVIELAGQRPAAHQTAPYLLAQTLREAVAKLVLVGEDSHDHGTNQV